MGEPCMSDPLTPALSPGDGGEGYFPFSLYTSTLAIARAA